MEVDLLGVANPEGEVVKLDELSPRMLKEHSKMETLLLLPPKSQRKVQPVQKQRSRLTFSPLSV